MHDLHPLDVAAIVLYLAGITALGIWMARRVRSLGDFFMPRRFGKGMMIMHAFGTGTASDQAVTVSSATFRGGLSGIWYQWLWLLATPFYWLIAPIFRRFRAVTTADVYELRFDRSVAVLFALVGIANMSVKIGLMLKGAGVLIESGTGALVDTDVAIVAVTLMFVVYGAAGGLSAAIVTDYVQGLLTILFSFMLLPFLFSAVGGMSGIRETVTNPDMLSLIAPGKITALFVVMMSIQALVGIVAQPFIMGVCAAGKTEWEGRVGFVGGNLVKRLCTIAWALTAIAAVAWYTDHRMLFEVKRGDAHFDVLAELPPDGLHVSQSGRDGIYVSHVKPDDVYGDVARRFLPQIMPGLLGIFIAALLAGVMSSCDSFMISSAGLFTENVYRPLFPKQTERHYVWVGRGVATLVVAGGVAFAFWVPNVVKALEIWFMIAPMMGLVFWIGLLWRRMTVAGAWATTLTGFATWWLTTQRWFVGRVAGLSQAKPLQLIWIEKGEPTIYAPWQILAYMTAAAGVGVLVSLATTPVAKEKLDRFYRLTRTPVAPGEKIERPCTLPPGTPPARRAMITTAFGLEIPMPSRASVVGFFLAWVAVAVLVGGFTALVQW